LFIKKSLKIFGVETDDIMVWRKWRRSYKVRVSKVQGFSNAECGRWNPELQKQLTVLTLFILALNSMSHVLKPGTLNLGTLNPRNR
jgi:hypothetical protein